MASHWLRGEVLPGRRVTLAALSERVRRLTERAAAAAAAAAIAAALARWEMLIGAADAFRGVAVPARTNSPSRSSISSKPADFVVGRQGVGDADEHHRVAFVFDPLHGDLQVAGAAVDVLDDFAQRQRQDADAGLAQPQPGDVVAGHERFAFDRHHRANLFAFVAVADQAAAVDERDARVDHLGRQQRRILVFEDGGEPAVDFGVAEDRLPAAGRFGLVDQIGDAVFHALARFARLGRLRGDRGGVEGIDGLGGPEEEDAGGCQPLLARPSR